MDGRRKLALLLAVAFYSFVLTIPALMPAPDRLDPLKPIGPLASLDFAAPSADEAMLAPLRLQANAALRELQASSL